MGPVDAGWLGSHDFRQLERRGRDNISVIEGDVCHDWDMRRSFEGNSNLWRSALLAKWNAILNNGSALRTRMIHESSRYSTPEKRGNNGKGSR
jgi:hypothetical protein